MRQSESRRLRWQQSFFLYNVLPFLCVLGGEKILKSYLLNKGAPMVKHIVMWQLKDKADAVEIKARLEALADRIPGLLSIEVGIDFLQSEQSADLVLVAELADRAALETYQQHPEHLAVVPLVKAAAISRTVADYDC